MKYFTLFALISLIPATLAAVAEDVELSKRQCSPTPCSCFAEPDGLFCGDGLLNCIPGHVYQCGDDGKKSCDFGPRNSCKQCGKLQCP